MLTVQVVCLIVLVSSVVVMAVVVNVQVFVLICKCVRTICVSKRFHVFLFVLVSNVVMMVVGVAVVVVVERLFVFWLVSVSGRIWDWD